MKIPNVSTYEGCDDNVLFIAGGRTDDAIQRILLKKLPSKSIRDLLGDSRFKRIVARVGRAS